MPPRAKVARPEPPAEEDGVEVEDDDEDEALEEQQAQEQGTPALDKLAIR
jgi:hypothetical protein